MDIDGIIKIFKEESQPRITVCGDFTLDKYLYVDVKRDELSLETGLTAFQVAHKKVYAGAGGTITNNLLALGAKVNCVGIVGNDGEGFELLKTLKEDGADISHMLQTGERNTGTYIKPMRLENNQLTEMNRIDIKNFTTTPMHLQKSFIDNLKDLLVDSDAVIISDQYIEDNCGAITDYVQTNLSALANKYNNIIWYVDSRSNIHKFKNMIVKCNHKEIAEAFDVLDSTINPDSALEYSKILYKKNQKPVYVTLGEIGSVLYDGNSTYKISSFKIDGEIDIVGAGDATNAGIVFSLAKGASYEQAALVGNAAASIVIKKIGQTGTASLAEILDVLIDKTKSIK